MGIRCLDRERDDEVNRLSSSQRDQAKLSEQSLTNFKRQVELNSSRMFDDMKKQVCGVADRWRCRRCAIYDLMFLNKNSILNVYEVIYR